MTERVMNECLSWNEFLDQNIDMLPVSVRPLLRDSNEVRGVFDENELIIETSTDMAKGILSRTRTLRMFEIMAANYACRPIRVRIKTGLNRIGDASVNPEETNLTREIIKGWMLEDGSGILYDKKNAGVFTGYITLTPERIALVLKSNIHNRALKEPQIDRLVDSINSGDWDANVSKINIDEHMVLSDGQNRMVAAQRSGKTIRILATVGVKETAQSCTDRRGTRTLEDDFVINGIPSARTVAAITRICYSIENGATVREMIDKNNTYYRFSDINLQRYYSHHEEEIQRLKNVCQRAYRVTQELHISTPVIRILTYSFDKIRPDDTRMFWDLLGSGVYDDRNDPIRQLRVKLVANASSGTQKIPKRVVAALIIKAWNLWQKGETVKQLKFTSGGASPEPFPEIYNPYENE